MGRQQNKKPRSTDLLGKGIERTLDDVICEELRPLSKARVLVVGDLMLDHYQWGDVSRTTPEAPVPIVRHRRHTWGLGAAANVAVALAALGCKARLVGMVGQDDQGKRLTRMVREAKLPASGIVAVKGRQTTVKTRILSMGQQLLRIDDETTQAPDAETVRRIVQNVEKMAETSDAILLSDYAKGVLAPLVIQAAVRAGRRHKIPVLVDPKGTDFTRYRGADVLTPNLREASEACGISLNTDEDLRQGRSLIHECGLKALVVTMGPEGMAVLCGRRLTRIPARAREVFDVTGAGDTAIATLAAGLAAGLSLEDSAVLANHAGGIVVGKLGVATATAGEVCASLRNSAERVKVRGARELENVLAGLRARGRRVVFTNGCFDLLHLGHIRFLQEARELGDVLVVGLNTDASVRRLKGSKRPILTQNERAAILSAIQAVDHIVFFDDETPEDLLKRLQPDVLVKGRNVPLKEVVGREIVKEYGGEVKRLPVLHKSAATKLVDSLHMD